MLLSLFLKHKGSPPFQRYTLPGRLLLEIFAQWASYSDGSLNVTSSKKHYLTTQFKEVTQSLSVSTPQSNVLHSSYQLSDSFLVFLFLLPNCVPQWLLCHQHHGPWHSGHVHPHFIKEKNEFLCDSRQVNAILNLL